MMFKKKTDMPDYDRKNNRNKEYRIVHMSPEEYIKKCSEGFGVEMKVGRYNIKRKKIVKYAKLMREGKAIFPMLVLDYSTGGFLQEGRHRAYAALIIGVEMLPVLIVERKINN